MKQESQYKYYLDALNSAKINHKIYVKTCFLIIFRMKKIENKKILLAFIRDLKEQNKDETFNRFLEGLNAKIEGLVYDSDELPIVLSQEIENF